jgi:glucose/arabinose dehydrogenase
MRASLATLLATTLYGATDLSGQPPLQAVLVASGLDHPTFAGAPPGDEDRLFIAEKATGRIRILKEGVLLGAPFLDLGTQVSPYLERGLLSFAFHPDYASNGWFYVHYTRASDGAIVVERYTVSATDPDVADASSALLLIAVPNPSIQIHIGGAIAFRPTDGNAGHLYLSIGDGAPTADPTCNAQNGQVLLGKILRIDVDPGDPLIPPTNPFVGDPGFRGEIWAYGFRNPWRMVFDRATGDMYVADVGEGTREEISFQSAQSPGGENYGWKIMEGTSCFSSTGCAATAPACNAPSLVPPIHDYGWNPTEGTCVIGGYVYRGCAIPGLSGTYFFADYGTSRFWSFRYDGTSVTELQERTAELTPASGPLSNVVSFAEDGRGELYFLNHVPGEVYEIVPAAPPAAVDLGFGKTGGNGEVPRYELCGMLGAGENAQVVLRRAPPATTASWLLSEVYAPVALPFGTLVPGDPVYAFPFTTDGHGRVQLTIPGGLGPVSLFSQWVLLDPGASAGLGFSNALRIDWP